MKVLLFLLSAFLMNTAALAQTTPAGSDKPFVVEYYYKTKWGHADEFLRLFKKNHYPLSKKKSRWDACSRCGWIRPATTPPKTAAGTIV